MFDKKSLLVGMALGGALVLSGMILGGLQQRPPQRGAEAMDAQLIRAREIQIVRADGRAMMRLTAQPTTGMINIYDDLGNENVRLNSILRGGGAITTMEDGITMVSIGSNKQGGELTVHRVDDDGFSANGVRIGGNRLVGGEIVVQDQNGEISATVPEDLFERAERARQNR